MPAQNDTKHYKISDVANLLNVSQNVIRNWESEHQIEVPRNHKNHRVYTQKEINTLKNLQKKLNSKSTVKQNYRKQQVKNFIRNSNKNTALAGLGAVLFILLMLNFPVFSLVNAGKEFINKALEEPINAENVQTAFKSSTDVLGERDRVANYVFEVSIPTNLGDQLTVEGPATFENSITAGGVILTETGSLAGLTTIDTATQTTLESTLTLAGDITGPINATTLSDELTYDGTFDISGTLNLSGELEADGETGSSGQVLTSTGSGVQWGDIDADEADTLDGLDSLQFLRSDTSDAYTSGTLSFSDGTFLDLSSIVHNDTAVQGLKLPQGSSLTAPTSGEGYLAYDTDDDQIYIYNGSSWTNISGASTPLQEAYEAGSTIQMDAASGDIRIYNDGSSEILFLDEDTARVGIGITAPSSALHVVGDITVTGTVDGKDIATNAAMLNEAETISADWVNTANPWADNEVADNLTISSSGSVDDGALSSNVSLLGQTIETGEITDDTILEADFDATNSATDDYILSFDNASGGFTWIANDGGSGASKWTDSGTITYLTETSDDLAIGGIGSTSNLFFDTSASGLTLNPFGTSSGNTGEIRFTELAANGTNYTGFKSPNSLGGNVIYTLPTSDGSSNQVLATDSSGTLSWIDVSAGSGATSGDITAVGSMTSGDVFSSSSADDAWLGLGASAGRIEFDSQTTDEINILDAYLGIGTTTPTSELHVVGDITVTGTVDGKDIATNAAMLDEAETISANWVNTANPWVDNEVSDTLTIGSSGSVDDNALSSNVSLLGQTIETGEITDGTILEADLSSTNSASDNYILSYDNSSGGFTWVANDGGSGASQWTTSGSNIYYNTGNVGIGHTDPQGLLHLQGTNGNQLYLAYDGTNYSTFDVSSTGDLSIGQAVAGADTIFTDDVKIRETLEVGNDFTGPTGVSASAGTGGTLDDDTYYISVAAIDGDDESIQSSEVTCNISTGNLDLVTTPDAWSRVFAAFGNGDGTFGSFSDYVVGDINDDATYVDLNQDGYIDAVTVSDLGDDEFSVILNDGDGTFGTEISYSTGGRDIHRVEHGDFNEDGYPDLLGKREFNGEIYIYLNNGDGTLSSTPSDTIFANETGPYDTPVVDVDNDGHLDIIYADSGPGVRVALGNGDGTWDASSGTLYSTTTTPDYITTADFNGDNYEDIAVEDSVNDNIEILLNDGDGTFGTATAYSVGQDPRDLVADDFDQDGDQDIVVANWTDDNISVLIGDGDGTFQSAVNYSVDASDTPQFIATGDLNGDTYPDIAVSSFLTENVSIFINDGDGTFGAETDVAHPSTSYDEPTSLELININPSSDRQCDISWNAASGADSYRVYYGTSSGGQDEYFTTSGTSYSITNMSGTSGTPNSESSIFFSATSDSYITDSNLGIGTTSPSTQLHITGDLTIGGDDLFMGTNTSGYLLVADGTNYNPVAVSGDINIDSAGATTIQSGVIDWSEIADATTLDATTTFDLDSNTADLNFDNGTLYIDNAGYIGIGTTAPTNALEVAGRAYTTNFTMTNGASNGYVLQSDATGAGTWVDPTTLDSGTVDGIEGNQFLRSDTSDSYTSGTLDFSDGTFLDLSAITHNDTAPQGFILPQNTTLSSPSSGEGYLAYDTDDDEVYVFDGSSWNALGGGLWTQNGSDIYFNTGSVGIGVTSPNAFLDILGTTEQLRLSYDSSNYSSFTIDSSGNLTISDSGTDVATFGEVQTSFETPTSFNSSGDVSIANDLLFSNQTASYIQSNAPLTIDTGESFENNNLTLKTYGTGNIVADLSGTGYLNLTGTDTSVLFNTTTSTDTDYWMGIIDDAGNDDDDIFSIGDGSTPGTNSFLTIDTAGQVGIGTTAPSKLLDVDGDTWIDNIFLSTSRTTNAYGVPEISSGNGGRIDFGAGSNDQASIYSLIDGGSTGLILEIRDDSEDFIDLRNQNSTILRATQSGRIGIGDTNPSYILTADHNRDGANVAYVNNSNAWTNGSADYAEYFYTEDTDLESGEVVCLDTNNNNQIVRCENAADSNVMGIISTSPAFLGNAPAEEKREDNENYKIVAMLGQIPAKVTSENGKIRIGDSLTPAEKPGHIMKANPGESTVAVALESFDGNSGTIQVMISRRNKSLTVENVEQEVTERIAQMEIEDEVSLMVSENMEKYEALLGMDADIETLRNDFGLLEGAQNSIQDRLSIVEDLLGLNGTEESTESTESSSTLAGLTDMLAEMETLFNEFKEFTEALGLSSTTDEDGNNVLAVNSDLNVTGNTTLSDVNVTGDLMAGLLKIDSIENSINIVGPDCTLSSSDTLCDTQTLHLQKNLAGNVDILDGLVLIKPDGTVKIDGTLEAEKVLASEISIKESGQTVGSGTLPSNETQVEIVNTNVTENSKVFITPNTSTGAQSLIVESKQNGKFIVKLDNPVSHNINFDWWIVNVE